MAERTTRGLALKQRRRRAWFYKVLLFRRTAARRRMNIEQRRIGKVKGLAAISSIAVLTGWYILRSRRGAAEQPSQLKSMSKEDGAE